MTQANTVLESIQAPPVELETLLLSEGSEDTEEGFQPEAAEVEDEKVDKAKGARRRGQAKKKHYTEDSIRLYLQEIGRIRLLRADEEIELARKIADLLALERIRDDLVEQLEREPLDAEWGEAVGMKLHPFRHRLHVGSAPRIRWCNLTCGWWFRLPRNT